MKFWIRVAGVTWVYSIGTYRETIIQAKLGSTLEPVILISLLTIGYLILSIGDK